MKYTIFMKKPETGDKPAKKATVKSDGVNKNVRNVWLVGIDEVGRGPLAGPVTVGAVAVLIDGTVARTYKNLRKKLMEISGKEYPVGIDSKKMKERDRDFWFNTIKRIPSLIISVESKSAQDIDKKGIAVCIADLVDINLKKILKKIQKNNKVMDASFENFKVLLDGGLKTKLPVGGQKTIIKGDEKELLISLASIAAKVSRDAYMKNTSKDPKYSQYGFELHKGYGTLRHRNAILKHGMSGEHRKSFCGRLKVV